MDLGARIYRIGFVHTLYYYGQHWYSQECPWYSHSQFQVNESMALIWELIVQNLGRVTYLPNVVSLFIVAISDLEVAAKVEVVKLPVLQ